jgi:prepilin-type N-terminal cleavage/methylation domain-containing protein
MFQRNSCKRAFTLIELLIVVAIIAILAAIAVPNFLEAQTRAKVSRTLNDLRSMATAVESYAVDYSTYCRDSTPNCDSADPSYPQEDFGLQANGNISLTTPVSYINSIFKDPFATDKERAFYRIGSGSWSLDRNATLYDTAEEAYGNTATNVGTIFGNAGSRGAYVLIGVGPDNDMCINSYMAFPFMSGTGTVSVDLGTDPVMPQCYTDYDSTNGSVSLGDIYRFSGTAYGHIMRNGLTIGEVPSGETSPSGAW